MWKYDGENNASCYTTDAAYGADFSCQGDRGRALELQADSEDESMNRGAPHRQFYMVTDTNALLSVTNPYFQDTARERRVYQLCKRVVRDNFHAVCPVIVFSAC